jgi:hypothetical protein
MESPQGMTARAQLVLLILHSSYKLVKPVRDRRDRIAGDQSAIAMATF